MSKNELKLETLKKAVKETAVPALINNAIRDRTIVLLKIDDMLKGVYRRPDEFSMALRDRLTALVDRVDARQYPVLLEMCPKGMDSRIPGWAYGPDVYVGYGKDGDWVLARM